MIKSFVLVSDYLPLADIMEYGSYNGVVHFSKPAIISMNGVYVYPFSWQQVQLVALWLSLVC